MVRDRTLDQVAGLVDDAVADPHGTRTSTIEIDRGARAEVVHQSGELRQRESGTPSRRPSATRR